MAPSDEATTDEATTETRWLGYARKQWLLASVVSAGVIAGGSISTFLETPRETFHWASEGMFGPDTYAGGADKASHFVDYAIVTKELANLYGVMGFSRRDSILMSAGVATLTGLVFEIGDGTNIYGFAWQDLTMDILGVGTAALISALELDDLLGFRHGFLLPPPPARHLLRGRGPRARLLERDLHGRSPDCGARPPAQPQRGPAALPAPLTHVWQQGLSAWASGAARAPGRTRNRSQLQGDPR